jgi:hypothetical protein
MGASAYWYYVPYQKDYNNALEELREREFKAGRYYPHTLFPAFPINAADNSSSSNFHTIEEAMEAAEETGTRSILDITSVSNEDDYCIARTLSSEELLELFETEQPEKDHIENSDDLYDSIERGKALCIPVYKDGIESELFFAGYSFD